MSDTDVFMASNSTFPGIFQSDKKMSFCSTASCASASQWKKQSLRSCCSSVYLLPSSCITRWVSSLLCCCYTTLSQFVQFVEDCVWLLECSPASCLAPRNHCEEKRKKFITRRINNKSPSHFSFDTGDAGTVFQSGRENVFVWKKHYSKSSSRNSESILMADLSISFSWYNTFHFTQRHPTCMFHRKQRFTWILASKMLASFSW